MNWQDRPEVQRGNIGERIVDDYMINRGMIPYVPQYPGPHPFDRLFINQNCTRIILADAKTKPARKYYPDTGINVAHLEKYQAAQEQLGTPVWLFFVDAEKHQMVYGNALNNLLAPIYVGDTKYPLAHNGICYFALDAMKKVRDLRPSEVAEISAHTTRSAMYGY